MSLDEFGRRNFLTLATGVAAGALLPETASAQATAQAAAAPPNAEEAGALHRKALQDASKLAAGESLIGKRALLRLVNELVEVKAITSAQAETLKGLIEAVFSSETIEAMQGKVESLFKGVEKGATDVAVALVSIARDSVVAVKEYLRGVPIQKVIEVVASDIQGGMTAAKVSASASPRVRIICIIAGAAASSSLALFRESKGTAVA